MSEEILNDTLMKSYRNEFEEFYNFSEHKPSLRHRIAMKKFFKTYNSRNRAAKHISPRIALAIILLAILGVCIAAVEIFELSDYSGVTNPQHTYLTFLGDTVNCPQTIEHIYVLENIPDGFEYADGGGEIGGSMASAIYWNADINAGIMFSQTVKSHFTNAEFNTEKYDLIETDVNGYPGFETVSKAEGYDSYHLVWDNGEYIFDIFFTYTLTKDEAEFIAKSAK